MRRPSSMISHWTAAPWYASAPYVTPGSTVTAVRALDLNAKGPTSVTLARSTVVRPESMNAARPIDSTVSGMTSVPAIPAGK